MLSPGQALAGFGSPALITLMGMFVLASPRIRTPQQLAALLPVVTDLAEGLGQPPLLFISAVVFAASQSFLSPIGYLTNLMVCPRQLPLPRLPALRLAALAALRAADSLVAAVAQSVPARDLCLRASLTFPHAPDTGVHR